MTSEQQWYTRPVLFVDDVDQALLFYQALLGFEKAWDYQDKNKTIVAQVNRGSKCEIILCENTKRAGLGRVFISLLPDEMKSLKKDIATKALPATESFWGMPVIEIKDPSGNELFFSTGQ